jgi:hypothetical protein
MEIMNRRQFERQMKKYPPRADRAHHSHFTCISPPPYRKPETSGKTGCLKIVMFCAIIIAGAIIYPFIF